MGKGYRVLDTMNLGIELDGGLARELRVRDLSYEDYFGIKRLASEAVNDSVPVSFVGNSYLLSSIGYGENSSCSVCMSWKQRNFFTSSGWENVEIPLELGGKEGSVLYVAHNADTDYIKSNLVKLWEIWLERALI